MIYVFESFETVNIVNNKKNIENNNISIWIFVFFFNCIEIYTFIIITKLNVIININNIKLFIFNHLNIKFEQKK